MILQKICPNEDRHIESCEEGVGLGRDEPAFYECVISLVEGTLLAIHKLFFGSKAVRKKNMFQWSVRQIISVSIIQDVQRNLAERSGLERLCFCFPSYF